MTTLLKAFHHNSWAVCKGVESFSYLLAERHICIDWKEVRTDEGTRNRSKMSDPIMWSEITYEYCPQKKTSFSEKKSVHV